MKTVTLFTALCFVTMLVCGQTPDAWVQKSNFAGGYSAWNCGFSIGNYGYVGDLDVNGLWQYDPSTDTWTEKANFPGASRDWSSAFTIEGNGYVGDGGSSLGTYDDFWQYNPSSNVWTQKTSIGDQTGRQGAVGFSIGQKGYIGMGYYYDQYIPFYYDFWEYDPSTDSWTQKADFGGGFRYGASSFSIGNYGYVGTGLLYDLYTFDEYSFNDFWQFDPSANTWTEKANFPGVPRGEAVGFALNGKGYIGTGLDGETYDDYSDVYEYDPATDSWTQKASFGGGNRNAAVAITIGGKAYVGTGLVNDNAFTKDFWEYTPDAFCAIPTGITVSNITASSAKITWNAVSGAPSYTVRYKIAESGAWTTLTTSTTQKKLKSLLPATEYTFQIKTTCSKHPLLTSDFSPKQSFTTSASRLATEENRPLQVYPNPVSSLATVTFNLLQPSPVCIKVYDISGKEIETVLNQDMQAGDQSIQMNASNLSKGIYFVRMMTNAGIEDVKLIVQ